MGGEHGWYIKHAMVVYSLCMGSILNVHGWYKQAYMVDEYGRCTSRLIQTRVAVVDNIMQ